ncbi:MAG: hypothetical protein IT173_06335 [Acidobacteria bacterium]|nr:hypothetical protein [Acidobacteriota bacterium]
MAVDNFGRLSGVADAQRTYLSGVTINDKGLLSQINLGNGTSETFAYNDRFQMEQQELKKGAEVLQKYVYGYGQVDANGVLQTAQNNGQLGTIESFIGANKQATQKFRYDHIGRLKESAEYRGDNNSLTYKQVFDFDRFGNLYRKAASNPPSGQQNPIAYTAIEEAAGPGTGDIDKATNRFRTQTTYDDAGQVVTDAKFRSMSFAYDANGRQVKAVRSGVPDAWTVYDALGNRVATKINDVWRYVVYDAFGKCVAEYGQLADGVGGVKYVQQDWQGSVRTVTNANGFVVSRTDHQAFGGDVGYGVGKRTIEQGYNRDAATRQGYGLTERDDASGLDHTWFRKNESSAGRWTSPDPYKGSMNLADPQSFNRYSYVQNQPTNFVDPSGLLSQGPRAYVEIRISWWDRMWEDHWGADNGGDFGWMYDPPGPAIESNGGGVGSSPGPSSSDEHASACPPDAFGIVSVKCLLKKAAEEYRNSPAGKFENCLSREMSSLNRELRKLMDRNYANWRDATGVGVFVGSIGMKVVFAGLGALAGSFTTLTSWYRDLAEFNNDKYEPARQAAITKCRRETGYDGNLNGRLNTNLVTM